MTLNVNELTFGVELETTLPQGTCPVGGYHGGVQVPQLPPGWKAEQGRLHPGGARATWAPRSSAPSSRARTASASSRPSASGSRASAPR